MDGYSFMLVKPASENFRPRNDNNKNHENNHFMEFTAI